MPLKDPEARKAYNREFNRRKYRDNPAYREQIRLRGLERQQKRWGELPLDVRQKRLLTKAKWKADRRAFIDKMRSVPCRDCGVSYPPYVMDFDHLPGTGKDRAVSEMLAFSVDKLMAEMAKCDVVCSNCHRIRTHMRRSNPEFIRPTSCGSGVPISEAANENQLEIPLDVDLEVS